MHRTVRPSKTRVFTFEWTNADVVALGAALSGEIALCGIPANTFVPDATVVVTNPATGVTTLVASVGTVAGRNNFVAASNAKAAASYAKAAALSSYLSPVGASETVYLKFLATGANLDQVLGSAGTVTIQVLQY